jgi:hypothetical protein
LHNGGLNPKTNFTNAHVYENDLVYVFGPKCVLKLVNPLIHVDTKHDLKKLHWQIYSVVMPNNNDFTFWLVKGYIAHEKGHEINWAKVIASTARKKAQRKNVGRIKSGSMELLDLRVATAST